MRVEGVVTIGGQRELVAPGTAGEGVQHNLRPTKMFYDSAGREFDIIR